MATVKEKVRINDAEFEFTLTPVLPSRENDSMVLDQPLPTPDEILERVPSIERLPRWEDGAPIPENRRAQENRRQEAIAQQAGVWGMVVPCADQPHAVKLCLRGGLIRVEWSPCDELLGRAFGLMAPCHQWVRTNQREIACRLITRMIELGDYDARLADWLIRHREIIIYRNIENARAMGKLLRRLKRFDLIAEMWASRDPAVYTAAVDSVEKDVSFEELRILFRELRSRGLIQGGVSSIYPDYPLKRIVRSVYYRELKGKVLLEYYRNRSS